MAELRLGTACWIDKSNHGFFGKGRIELLKEIDAHGSLSKAAKSMKMSYKAAWDALKEMETLSGEVLTKKTTGGKGGGGSTLTHKAHNYIALYEALQSAQKTFFDSISLHLDDVQALMQLLSRPSIRTSARNQLACKLKKITPLNVNAKLTLELEKDIFIDAHITQTSVRELGLTIGQNLFAIIKASSISTFTSKTQAPSETNLINAKILTHAVEEDMYEITVIFGSQILVATGSIDKLPICKKDDLVYISFFPEDVIVGC
ncbi:MAG: LysR family transcriptional regulator [Campylobacteraceae bacterium]|jgi:molybdate transport system regulatory protein|nr:LysR family transcriptional regulator [Campylobacteraceae bacterium]